MNNMSYPAPRNSKAYIKVCRQNALHRQGGLCHYCDTPLTSETVTADHKHPRAKGGRHTSMNIAAACSDCNNAKGNMTEGQFFKAVKKPPSATTPFPIMLAWMRRKLNTQTKRSSRRLDKQFNPSVRRSSDVP
ncbi:HNH endonuclease [Microvirga sp. TS319]